MALRWLMPEWVFALRPWGSDHSPVQPPQQVGPPVASVFPPQQDEPAVVEMAAVSAGLSLLQQLEPLEQAASVLHVLLSEQHVEALEQAFSPPQPDPHAAEVSEQQDFSVEQHEETFSVPSPQQLIATGASVEAATIMVSDL